MNQNTSNSTIDNRHFVLFFLCVLVIPLIEGLGLLSIALRPLFFQTTRPAFWAFLTSIIILHWLSFTLIYKMLKSNLAFFIKVDMHFFRRHRYSLIVTIVVLIVLAFIAPRYLYGNTYPGQSIMLNFLGPVSEIERVVFLALALTAGICEEVIFRGFAITVLEHWFKNKPVALIFSSLAFMSIHGLAFVPWPFLIQYFIIGLIFGFFYQKYRRLEILILIHVLLDALVAVGAP